MATYAGLPVLLAGLYLVGLGIVALVSPQKAKLFLSGFAGSAFAHVLELFVRLAVGAALVSYAPHMRFPGVFSLFGWVLIGTTIILFAVPWRWHRRFAEWSVPIATRRMALFALGALAGGIFVLLSLMPDGACC